MIRVRGYFIVAVVWSFRVFDNIAWQSVSFICCFDTYFFSGYSVSLRFCSGAGL